MRNNYDPNNLSKISLNIANLFIKYLGRGLCILKKFVLFSNKIIREIIIDIERKGNGFWRNWSLTQIINDCNVEGESILHLAVANEDYSTCCLVIEKGANINLCRNGYITPLHLAATSGIVEICKLLVASGADLEAQNERLQTPLHKAARNNRVPVVNFLISK